MKQNNSFIKKIKVISFGSAMADMAFLLLIFFMITTSTEPPKGAEVNLPQAKTKGAEQDSLYISISNKAKLYFDGQPITLTGLRDKLAMRQGEVEKTVAITADKDLDYSIVAEVLSLLREKDFLNIVFMSVPRPE